MANLTMPDKEMGSRRFLQFMALAGMDRRQALGQLLLFWDGTRAARLDICTRPAAALYLDGDNNERARVLAALHAAGYVADIEDQPGMLRILGNDRAMAYTESRRARGRCGAAKSREKRSGAKVAKKAGTKPAAEKALAAKASAAPDVLTEFKEACRVTWIAYAQAYEAKTCHLPVRNAKLNAQIQQIVKRLGHTESPAIIRFYVEQVTDKAVVENLWSLDIFLRRAESLATQYKMGRPINARDAQDMADSAAYYARQRSLLDGA